MIENFIAENWCHRCVLIENFNAENWRHRRVLWNGPIFAIWLGFNAGGN